MALALLPIARQDIRAQAPAEVLAPVLRLRAAAEYPPLTRQEGTFQLGALYSVPAPPAGQDEWVLAVDGYWGAAYSLANAWFGTSVQILPFGPGNSAVLAVGMDGFDWHDGRGANAGRVVLYPGMDGGISMANRVAIDGPRRGARFGAAIAGQKDLTGDGIPDLLVGAPNFRGGHTVEGVVILYRGTGDGRLIERQPYWTMESNRNGVRKGSSILVPGDMNGDGRGEIVAGMPMLSKRDREEGAILVFSAGPEGPDRIGGALFFGEVRDAKFGTALAPLGDVTGDGLPDFLASAPFLNGAAFQSGQVRLYSGSRSSFVEGPIQVLDAAGQSGHFGAAMAPIQREGKTTGVAISAPGREDGTSGGIVYALAIGADGKLGPAEWAVRAEEDSSTFGAALAVGDLNADGWPDLVASAPTFSASASRQGRVYLFPGQKEGFAQTPAWVIDGASAEDQIGWSLASGGDLNGDGIDDLVIGSPHEGSIVTEGGRVDVFFGSRFGLVRSLPAPAKQSKKAVANAGTSTISGTLLASASAAGLCGLGALALGYYFAGRRVRRERHLAGLAHAASIRAEREKIARYLHDDLGGELARLGILSGMSAKAQTGKPVSPAEVARAASELNQRVERIIWILHPGNDRLERFLDFIADDAERLCRESGMKLRTDVPIELPDVELNRVFRENFHLAAKEAVTNALRHSGGSELQLRASAGERSIELVIEDNGRGMPEADGATAGMHREGHGHGLDSVRKRMSEIDGTVRIERAEGGGTRITLTAPLPPF